MTVKYFGLKEAVIMAFIIFAISAAGSAYAFSGITGFAIKESTLSFQSSLTPCDPNGDVAAQCGARHCTCNGIVKPYCIDGEDWRVKTPRCDKGVSTSNPGKYYCVTGSSTSSQKDQYTCDNGQSVWNNPTESGLPVWCTDSYDNDYDGTKDCEDSDCSSLSVCQTCESGQVAVGQCSVTKPKYCQSRNSLVDKCSSCGCLTGQFCNQQTGACEVDSKPEITASFTSSGQYAGDNKFYAGTKVTLTADITDDKGISLASWSGDKLQGSSIQCSGKVCPYSTAFFNVDAGANTVTLTATDTKGQTSTRSYTFTVISCTSNSQCGSSLVCTLGKCAESSASQTRAPTCGDNKCHSDMGESYDSCPIDCPSPAPIPIDSQGRQVCGTIVGHVCKPGYRCDYGSGRNFPPYPDAGGSCVPTSAQSPIPTSTSPIQIPTGNLTEIPYPSLSPTPTAQVGPTIFPRCGGPDNSGCPSGYFCNYGGGKTEPRYQGAYGFCILTGDITGRPTASPEQPQIGPSNQTAPQQPSTARVLSGREIVPFGESRIIGDSAFRVDIDQEDTSKETIIIADSSGQQIKLKEGESTHIGEYYLTLNTVLMNLGADLSLSKEAPAPAEVAKPVTKPITIDEISKALDLTGEENKKLKAISLILSILGYIE